MLWPESCASEISGTGSPGSTDFGLCCAEHPSRAVGQCWGQLDMGGWIHHTRVKVPCFPINWALLIKARHKASYYGSWCHLLLAPTSETGKSGIGKEADSRFSDLTHPHSALTIQFSCWFHGMRQESHPKLQVLFPDRSCSSRLLHIFPIPADFCSGISQYFVLHPNLLPKQFPNSSSILARGFAVSRSREFTLLQCW